MDETIRACASGVSWCTIISPAVKFRLGRIGGSPARGSRPGLPDDAFGRCALSSCLPPSGYFSQRYLRSSRRLLQIPTAFVDGVSHSPLPAYDQPSVGSGSCACGRALHVLAAIRHDKRIQCHLIMRPSLGGSTFFSARYPLTLLRRSPQEISLSAFPRI